ncbi:MAG: GNAT family N-acetyltransferase [Chloroflexota bacterium]|nr:GNAT family N-acetyltransferase [Chloroflexota bacterium]
MPADGLTVLRHGDAAAFLRRSRTFLVAREAEHNLLLGLAGQLVEDPARYVAAPYLATVERGGEVVAAALMTPPDNLQSSLADDQAAPGAIAADVRAGWAALPGVAGPTAEARAFAERWRELAGQPFRLGMAQRIYALERVVPVAGVPGAARRATAADRTQLADWMVAFSKEALGDEHAKQAERAVDLRLGGPGAGFFLWEDGAPVCMVGFTGPTPHGIRIAPVYTPSALRGRGYGSAATAAASQALLDEGRRFCFLHTDLANPTSNRIYQAIGYRPVIDVTEFRFG